MKAPKFEEYKVLRLLKTQGVQCDFVRDVLDKFKEPTGYTTQVASFLGFYHEQTSYLSVTGTESSLIQKKKVPYVLTLKKYIGELRQGDKIVLFGKSYKVCGVDDVNNWGLIADISLEEAV